MVILGLLIVGLGEGSLLTLLFNVMVSDVYKRQAYGGVSAIFAVNILVAPLDAMLTEITNEASALAGGAPITLVSNFYFQVVSSFVLSVVAALVTDRIVEPRLGVYEATQAEVGEAPALDAAGEARGMRFAGLTILAYVVFILLLTLPSGAPLRDPQTGDIIGATPFMDSLLFIITILFLLAGIAYGRGAKTMTTANQVIAAVTKTFAGLAGLVFMLLMISQFIAYFNFSNMPNVIAVALAGFLEQANIGSIPLLIGFMLVIMLLDIIIPGSMPKWAIFAPIFVPLFMRCLLYTSRCV